MYALYERFLKPTLTPDPQCLREFDQLTERYFNHLTRLADRDEQIEEEITNFDPLEWLNTREFDNKKKDDYL